jgi:Flp pilus assembly protein TadG
MSRQAHGFSRARNKRGQAAVEFSAVLLLMVILLFGVLEVGRLMLSYQALAEGVRIAARYASVHGYYQQGLTGTAPGYCDSSPVSPGSSLTPDVATVIQNYSGLSPITVAICYSSNKPGQTVTVSAYYDFSTIASVVPLGSFTLSSTSKAIFCY